jgi:hypothetical protein
MRNICKEPDCDGTVTGFGLCGKHWLRQHKARPDRRCAHGECDKPIRGWKLCAVHLYRLERYGDPDREHVPGGYSAIHHLLRKRFGAARTHVCVDCGRQARHWSYDHADRDERTDDTGLRYSTKPEHYQPRCVPCHHIFDGTTGNYRHNQIKRVAQRATV